MSSYVFVFYGTNEFLYWDWYGIAALSGKTLPGNEVLGILGKISSVFPYSLDTDYSNDRNRTNYKSGYQITIERIHRSGFGALTSQRTARSTFLPRTRVKPGTKIVSK